MKQFYLYRPKANPCLSKIDMDRQNILSLMCHAPSSLLSTDLEKWRDKAKPGEAFFITSDLVVLVLDLDLDRMAVGPTKLTNMEHSTGSWIGKRPSKHDLMGSIEEGE